MNLTVHNMRVNISYIRWIPSIRQENKKENSNEYGIGKGNLKQQLSNEMKPFGWISTR